VWACSLPRVFWILYFVLLPYTCMTHDTTEGPETGKVLCIPLMFYLIASPNYFFFADWLWIDETIVNQNTNTGIYQKSWSKHITQERSYQHTPKNINKVFKWIFYFQWFVHSFIGFAAIEACDFWILYFTVRTKQIARIAVSFVLCLVVFNFYFLCFCTSAV
jgi:hypothetical protein